MSSGKKSELFRPIEPAMLAAVEASYPAAAPHVRALHAILTDACRVETLLFMAVVDALDRAIVGVPASILLSAVLTDGSGKAQTAEMELVHDVLVELPMAGRNHKRLQAYLGTLGFEWCMMHSCGGDCVPADGVDAWYDARASEQLLRTRLDWEGRSLKNVPEAFIRVSTRMAPEELATISRIAARARALLPAAVPLAA